MTRVTSDLVLSTSDRNGFVSMACTIGRQFGQVEENPVNPDGVDPETEAQFEVVAMGWIQRLRQ